MGGFMTALAKRIKETPMAPYAGLIQAMTDEEKRIVVMFIKETMEKKESRQNSEIIRAKFKGLAVPPEIEQLRGCIKLTDEDLKDEHIK